MELIAVIHILYGTFFAKMLVVFLPSQLQSEFVLIWPVCHISFWGDLTSSCCDTPFHQNQAFSAIPLGKQIGSSTLMQCLLLVLLIFFVHKSTAASRLANIATFNNNYSFACLSEFRSCNWQGIWSKRERPLPHPIFPLSIFQLAGHALTLVDC